MEPERLVDDPETPPELRALLARAPRARALDDGTRSRVHQRWVAAVAVPVGLSAVLSAGTVSAAVGVVSGVAVGAATIGVIVVGGEVADAWLADTPSKGAPAPSRSDRGARTPPPSAAPATSVTPLAPVELHDGSEAISETARTQPRSRNVVPAAPTAPTGLGEESALLEAARRALAVSPAHALELAREHRRRFAPPRLAPERSLIEIDALVRLGRRAEAEALAQSWLASGAGTVYEHRVRRLLDSRAGSRLPP